MSESQIDWWTVSYKKVNQYIRARSFFDIVHSFIVRRNFIFLFIRQTIKSKYYSSVIDIVSFRFDLKRNMYGCYLTAADDQFLDLITDELNKYNLSTDTSLCVGFCLFRASLFLDFFLNDFVVL